MEGLLLYSRELLMARSFPTEGGLLHVGVVKSLAYVGILGAREPAEPHRDGSVCQGGSHWGDGEQR